MQQIIVIANTVQADSSYQSFSGTLGIGDVVFGWKLHLKIEVQKLDDYLESCIQSDTRIQTVREKASIQLTRNDEEIQITDIGYSFFIQLLSHLATELYYRAALDTSGSGPTLRQMNSNLRMEVKPEVIDLLSHPNFGCIFK